MRAALCPKIITRTLAHRTRPTGHVLEWCFEKGRRLNPGDILVWNGFASKLGWRDFATPTLQRAKQKAGAANRDDLVTIPDFIDFDEGRRE
jgi:hypothetical protein